MITKQGFIESLNLLADNYGDDYPVFRNQDIAEAWFNFFKEVCHTDEKLKKIFTHYIVESMYFPKAPREIITLWDDSGKDRPSENYLSLPSTEDRLSREQKEELDNMSLEDMAENRKKIPLILAIAKTWNGLNSKERLERINELCKHPASELQMMFETCRKSDRLKTASRLNNRHQLKATQYSTVEDMRKYLHSSSDKYRQLAIDWASDPKNGAKLVKNGSKVVDIREIEF